jgi:hypothetical protein
MMLGISNFQPAKKSSGSITSTDEFEINRPMKIVVIPTQQGMQISLMPWVNSILPGADMTYKIKPEFVVAHGSCDPELAKSYKQQVTGIALG